MTPWTPYWAQVAAALLYVACIGCVGAIFGKYAAAPLVLYVGDMLDVVRCARKFIASSTREEIERNYESLRFNVRWLDGERDSKRLHAPQTVKPQQQQHERMWN